MSSLTGNYLQAGNTEFRMVTPAAQTDGIAFGHNHRLRDSAVNANSERVRSFTVIFVHSPMIRPPDLAQGPGARDRAGIGQWRFARDRGTRAINKEILDIY